MLRFTLFGFPVLIHWMFWLNGALMGGALWASGLDQILGVLIWMAAVFISILIHELGHALTMRNFGDRQVGIVLFAFGGLAQGRRHLARNEDILVTLAGPGLQILAGLAAGWSMALWRPGSPWLLSLMDAFTVVSIFWALLNLVPVLPLDGGRLCAALLGLGEGKLALKISLACAVTLIALSLFGEAWQQTQSSLLHVLDIPARTRVGGGAFTLLFFGMLALNNWKQLKNEPQIPWMNAR